jgi:hypothetical protein
MTDDDASGSPEGNLQRCMPSRYLCTRPAWPNLGRHTIWRGGTPRATTGHRTSRPHSASPRTREARRCDCRFTAARASGRDGTDLAASDSATRRPCTNRLLVAQAKDPAPADRRCEAGHAHDRTLGMPVYFLEAMQSVERLRGDARHYADDHSEITQIPIEPARVLLDHPSEQRRRRPEELRPHLLDVRVGQPPPIIGLRRDRHQVQRRTCSSLSSMPP